MAKIQYHSLNVLVADDFSNFRSTVNRMLMDMGVVNIDMASNSEEILEQCSRQRYDVVLCDYNLGNGRNGQHVLEELRFNNYLDLRSIFVLVSAEASRNIVMSAYDSAPDDYLMKPITAQMLHNRLERLLQLRLVLAPVYTAINNGDPARAMDLLIDLSIAEDRFAGFAQKMLGEMFLKHGEFKKAEKLYMRVLEVRELDWARLGLAKAKHLQGDHDQAGQWLQQIVEENYLYLPAYDVLADNWLDRGQAVKAQAVVQSSVDVSPMSILRQKNLAELAMKNGDVDTAVEALKRVIKLGKLSCYGNSDDGLALVRAIASAIEQESNVAPALITEALQNVQRDTDAMAVVSTEQRVQRLYLQSRLAAVRGETDTAKAQLVEAETSLLAEDSNIDIEVDHIRALIALNYSDKMHELLKRLQELYADDQHALERLDEFLDEPASDANKAMVAEVNRRGIDLYNNGEFDDALLCFNEAKALFPKHIGLQLNIVQALIGKLKADPQDDNLAKTCRETLEQIAQSIAADNPQFKRFNQLKHMVKNFYSSQS